MAMLSDPSKKKTKMQNVDPSGAIGRYIVALWESKKRPGPLVGAQQMAPFSHALQGAGTLWKVPADVRTALWDGPVTCLALQMKLFARPGRMLTVGSLWYPLIMT